MREKIYFKNSRGDKICGILSNPTNNNSKPIVILCHGFSTSKNSSTNLQLEQILNNRGISILRFDFFGHGESGGLFEDITISEAVDDILNAIKYLKNKSYSKIALIGSSFGGLASIMAASKTGSLFALALKAPVSNYKEYDIVARGKDGILEWKEKGYCYYISGNGKKYKLNYTFFEDYDKNNGYEVASKIKTPTLIVHGDADKIVPIQQSRKIVSFIQNSELVELKGCGHKFDKIFEFEKMLDLMANFIIRLS